MITRIVKMTFEEGKENAFLEVFNNSKEKIRNFKGCTHLELLRAKDKTNVFMTYSRWENEQSLNNYRASELFKSTWAQTKILFCDKPEALTLEQLY
jgi:heme-degrading monooxygenase HmoA